MTQDKIGKYIAECRENKKLTQRMLGERLGVSMGKVQSWEEGHSIPGTDLVEPLCRILEINGSDLFSAKNLKEAEKNERGEKAAIAVLATKPQLKLLELISIILIIYGVVLAVILPTVCVNSGQKVLTIALGAIVAAFGILFRVFLGKAVARLEKE